MINENNRSRAFRFALFAQETFGKKDRATALINETINKLEGDLL